MRHVCRLLLIAVLLSPVAAVAAVAADDASLTVARQVVDLAVAPGVDARIDRMIGDAVARQPADKQAKVRADLTAATAGTREDLIKVFAGYYAKSFTPAELKELLAFYRGPLGAKALRVEQKKPAEVDAAIEQQIVKLVVLIKPFSGQ